MTQVLLRDYRLSGCTSFVATSPASTSLYAANSARKRIEVFRSVPASLHWIGESAELGVAPQTIFSDGSSIFALGVNTLYMFTADTTPILIATFTVDCPAPTWGLCMGARVVIPQGEAGIQVLSVNAGYASTPVISPAAGAVLPGTSVTITDSTVGASIYYTTDGTTPTSGSTLYTGAFTVTGPTSKTVKAIAVATGFNDSAVATSVYSFAQVATPVIAPSTLLQSASFTCTITCSTAASTIYYTTNGTAPTTSSTLYTAGFSITTDTTVKAFAVATGRPDSAVASSAYTIQSASAINAFQINGSVYGNCVWQGLTIVVGSFATVTDAGGIHARAGFAAFDNATGLVSTFASSVTSGTASCCCVDSADRLWVGGNFAMGAVSQLVRFDANRSLSAFNGQTNSTGVECVVPYGTGVLAVGPFTTVLGGTTRNRMALFNSDGTLNAFAPSFDEAIHKIAIDAATSDIYAVGRFNAVTGTNGAFNRRHVAAITSAGAVKTFDPTTAGSDANHVYAVHFASNLIYVGGQITVAGRNQVAVFNTSGALQTFNPTTSGGDVRDIVVQTDGKIMVAGSFTAPIGLVARYTAAGAVDGTFTSGLTGSIGVQLTETPGYCLLGGSFTCATTPAGDYFHAFVH